MQTEVSAREQFSKLIDQSSEADHKKQDFRLQAKNLSFDHDGKLVIVAPALPYDDGTYIQRRMQIDTSEPLHRVVGMTDHAEQQLFAKLGAAHYGKGSNKGLPGEYLGFFPPSMRADILNWTLERSTNAVKVRVFEDTCRAVVDGDYPRIWNTDVLSQLARVLNEKDGIEGLSIDRPFVTPDEFFTRIWWIDAGTGNYRVGATFSNNEVGIGKFTGRPMIRRISCANSVVVSDISAITGQAAGFQMVHYRGASAEAMMTQFYAQLPALLNASAALINRMIEAESVAIPDFRQVLDGLKIEHGWNADFMDKVDEGTEGKRTFAGIINGITFAAHMDTNTSNVKGLELETIAGDYLVSKQPLKVFAQLAAQGKAGKRVRA